MKIFKKLVDVFKLWYERHFGEYTPVREFNFKKAQEFYENHRSELEEMAFCMGFDDSIWSPVVENGVTIAAPICFNNVDGVERTFYDVPCFYYKFKGGRDGKMYCFREYGYNKKSQTFKYICYFGIPEKHPRFGVFEEYLFENRMKKMYEGLD